MNFYYSSGQGRIRIRLFLSRSESERIRIRQVRCYIYLKKQYLVDPLGWWNRLFYFQILHGENSLAKSGSSGDFLNSALNHVLSYSKQ